MIPPPPCSTPTDTLFPCTTLCRPPAPGSVPPRSGRELIAAPREASAAQRIGVSRSLSLSKREGAPVQDFPVHSLQRQIRLNLATTAWSTGFSPLDCAQYNTAVGRRIFRRPRLRHKALSSRAAHYSNCILRSSEERLVGKDGGSPCIS